MFVEIRQINMKVAVKILDHTFIFFTNQDNICSYIKKEYGSYVIPYDLTETSHYMVDVDALVENSQIPFESVIKNVVINNIYSEGLYYIMHAGVIIMNDIAVLICGKTTSGKSTACFLMHELYGLGCMADDIALINRLSLTVEWIKSPIRLRQKVVDKYDLYSRVFECGSDGNGQKRFLLYENEYDNTITEVPIGAVVEIQYVDDASLQSMVSVSGMEAVITVLSNSYSQDRLPENYGVIANLAQSIIIKKVRYHDPQYLYDVLVSSIKEKNDG